MPMMEKIVQTAKQMVKATVDSQRARAGASPCLACRGSDRVMLFSRGALENKKAADQGVASGLAEAR
jgi:hypothetical protein